MISSRIYGFLALVLPLVLLGVEEADARRVALVIGNDDYMELPELKKAEADATDFAAVLEEKDFDEVILQRNLTRLQMDLAVSEFLETINPGDTAVFFYSGHGWSDGSRNFLVGTDVPKSAGGVALARLSIPLQNGANGIIDSMSQQGASLKIVIVDACRDNPFEPQVAGRSAGIGRGLARVEPPNGTFVVFSAGTGQVALDRLSDEDQNRNSVFTRTFLPLVESDLPLLDVVKTTQEKVYELARQVRHEQEPAYYDQVRGDACLSLTCQTADLPTVVQPAPRDPALEKDVRFWIAIENSDNPAEYAAFLQLFPQSDLTTLARIRLENLESGYWSRMSQSGRPGDLERYLQYYPEGRHAGEAKAQLAEVQQRQIIVEAAPEPSATDSEQPAEEETVTSAVAEPETPAEPTAEEDAPEAAEAEGAPEAAVDVALADPDETPAEPDPGNVALSGRDLIVALQEVLKRAGCYTSRIDGIWGRRSQGGLEKLLRLSDIDAKPQPTVETLGSIEHVSERVCPVVVTPKPVRRKTTTTRRRQQAPVVAEPTVRQRPPEPPREEFGFGGNPRAKCGRVLSPADPNFGSPGDLNVGSC